MRSQPLSAMGGPSNQQVFSTVFFSYLHGDSLPGLIDLHGDSLLVRNQNEWKIPPFFYNVYYVSNLYANVPETLRLRNFARNMPKSETYSKENILLLRVDEI